MTKMINARKRSHTIILFKLYYFLLYNPIYWYERRQGGGLLFTGLRSISILLKLYNENSLVTGSGFCLVYDKPTQQKNVFPHSFQDNVHYISRLNMIALVNVVLN